MPLVLSRWITPGDKPAIVRAKERERAESERHAQVHTCVCIGIFPALAVTIFKGFASISVNCARRGSSNLIAALADYSESLCVCGRRLAVDDFGSYNAERFVGNLFPRPPSDKSDNKLRQLQF